MVNLVKLMVASSLVAAAEPAFFRSSGSGFVSREQTDAERAEALATAEQRRARKNARRVAQNREG